MLFPLLNGMLGEMYTIQKVKGKLNDRLELEAVGIFPGVQIRICSVVGSIVVCMIAGKRFSISRQQAESIFVTE